MALNRRALLPVRWSMSLWATASKKKKRPLPQNTGCGSCTGHNEKLFPHCLNKSQSISSSRTRSHWRHLHSVISPPFIIIFSPCLKLLVRGEAPSILPEGNSDKIRVFFMTKHRWLLIRTVLIDGRTTRVHPCEKSRTSQIFKVLLQMLPCLKMD